MKILAFDTSTRFLCLAVFIDGKTCEYTLEVGPKLSVLLTPTIKRVLDALKLDIKEIDYFACGLGPGSFTGMRVGLSAVKGLSWALNKPVVGIPTLDILVSQVERNYSPKVIVPIIDAKRNLIYTAFYKYSGQKLKKESSYLLISKEALFKKIKTPAVFMGDALGLYKDEILKNNPGAILLDKDYWYPKPQSLIHLALERIRANKQDDPFTLKPIYIYPKECQIKKCR